MEKISGGGGGTHIFGVVLTQVLAVLTMLKGERKKFPPVLPWGRVTMSWGGGGGAKCFGPAISPFCSPPPPPPPYLMTSPLKVSWRFLL